MYIIIKVKNKNSYKFQKELEELLVKNKKIANRHTTFSDKEYESGSMVDLV